MFERNLRMSAVAGMMWSVVMLSSILRRASPWMSLPSGSFSGTSPMLGPLMRSSSTASSGGMRSDSELPMYSSGLDARVPEVAEFLREVAGVDDPPLMAAAVATSGEQR